MGVCSSRTLIDLSSSRKELVGMPKKTVIVKKRSGEFVRLSEKEAEDLVKTGKAQYYEVQKEVKEPPKNKMVSSPDKKKSEE